MLSALCTAVPRLNHRYVLVIILLIFSLILVGFGASAGGVATLIGAIGVAVCHVNGFDKDGPE